jgi:hypothetical protein
MPRRPQTPPPDAPTEDTDPVAVTIAALSFDEEFEKLNLFQRLARISGHVGNVPKKGYNAFHKYHYVTEADLVGAVRQYLAAAGILMIPDVIETTQLSDELTKVVVEYTVTDGGASFTFKVPGYGSDRGDKGVYKALTGSMKYAIMKLFKIETGDDPEQDTRVDERAACAIGRPLGRSRSGLGPDRLPAWRPRPDGDRHPAAPDRPGDRRPRLGARRLRALPGRDDEHRDPAHRHRGSRSGGGHEHPEGARTS